MNTNNAQTPKFSAGDHVTSIDSPDWYYYTVRTSFISDIYGVCYWVDGPHGGEPLAFMEHQLRLVGGR